MLCKLQGYILSGYKVQCTKTVILLTYITGDTWYQYEYIPRIHKHTCTYITMVYSQYILVVVACMQGQFRNGREFMLARLKPVE